mmetsp:Transcript_20100/g.34593  ORF Transcript_20100/g.34593 Transcript_20100/m.34593 type:complete len:161 (+) Transcript_20100:168-650(+)
MIQSFFPSMNSSSYRHCLPRRKGSPIDELVLQPRDVEWCRFALGSHDQNNIIARLIYQTPKRQFWRPNPKQTTRTISYQNIYRIPNAPKPPSTMSVCPVTYPLAPDAKKTVGPTKSSGSEFRPTSVASASFCARSSSAKTLAVSSVRTYPGPMLLHVTFS